MAEIGHISHTDATDVMANSILPNVKVTKITLNGGASANISEFESDPHIGGYKDSIATMTEILEGTTADAYQGVVGKIYGDDQTSDTPQDTLSVSVDVEMFELEENILNNALLFDTAMKTPDVFGYGSAQNTPEGLWAHEGDTLIPALANYIKIRILLLDTADTLTGVNAVTQEHIGALDPVLYHEILSDANAQYSAMLALAKASNMAPEMWPKLEDYLNFDSDPSYVLRDLTTAMAEALKSTVPEMNGDHRVKDLSIKNDSVLGPLKIDELELSFGQAIQNKMFHITKNKNGKRIVHIPFRHTFNTFIKVKDGKPETQNLAVVAYSYIDIEGMMNDSSVLSSTEGEMKTGEMMKFELDENGQPIAGTGQMEQYEYFVYDVVSSIESTKELYGMKDSSPHLMGTPWAEIVYYKGDQRTKRKVFFTSDGKVYNGNVEYDPQTATYKIAGSYLNKHVFTEHASQGEVLTAQDAPNAVVQNNLVIKRLSSWASGIDFEQSFLQQNESLKGTSIAPSGDVTPYGNGIIDPSRSKKPSYFSQAYMTKDANGHVRFLFSLDFKKLLMNNSPFPYMYNTSESFMQWGTIEELLKLGHIKTIKIMRQRVNPEMVRAGSDPLAKNGYDKFSDSSSPVLLLETNKTNMNNGIATLNEITLNTSTFSSQIFDAELLAEDGTEISTSAGSLNSLRHFVVTDKSITPQMVGKYQYGVEITVRESAREYLNMLLDKLVWARRNLENYYIQANSFYADPNGGINSKKPYFDNIYQKFIPEFWESIKLLYGDPALDNIPMPYWRTVDLYIEVLTILTRPGFFDIMGMNADLRNLCDPILGSPSGILLTMGLMDNLISYMSSKLGATKKGHVSGFEKATQTVVDGAFSGQTSQSSTVPLGFFKHRHMFYECIDLTEEPRCHYDYLSTSEQDILPPFPSNLRIFTREGWLNRTLREDYKYFEKTAVESDLDVSLRENTSMQFGPGYIGEAGDPYTLGDSLSANRNSFLGPSSISLVNQPPLRMVKSEYIDDAEYFKLDKYYNMFCDIINFNLNKNTTFTSAMFSADFGKVKGEFGSYLDLDIVQLKPGNASYGGKLGNLFTRQKLNEIFNYHYSLVVQDPAYLESLQQLNDNAQYLIDNPDKAAEQIEKLKNNAAAMAAILEEQSLEDGHITAADAKEIFDDMIENAEILTKGESDGLAYGKSYPPPRQDRGLNTVKLLLSLLRLVTKGEQYYTFDNFSSTWYTDKYFEVPSFDIPLYSMNNYNINSNSGLLKRYVTMRNSLYTGAANPATLGPVDPVTGKHVKLREGELGQVPNSIKSLFLQNTFGLPKGSLRKNYLVEGYDYDMGSVNDISADPMQDPYQREDIFPFMLFNYHMTQRIEYLEAYSQDTTTKSISDDFSVKGPVWKRLTQEVLDSPPGDSNGKYLFCRLVPHKNNLVAIDCEYAMGEQLKLPIIDEYFLIDLSSPDPPKPEIPMNPFPDGTFAEIMDDTLNADKVQVIDKVISKGMSGIDDNQSAVSSISPISGRPQPGLPRMGDNKRMSDRRNRQRDPQRGRGRYSNIRGGMAHEPGPGKKQHKLTKKGGVKKLQPNNKQTDGKGAPMLPKYPGKNK